MGVAGPMGMGGPVDMGGPGLAGPMGMAGPGGGMMNGGSLLQMGLGGGDMLTGSEFALNRETRRGGILSFLGRFRRLVEKDVVLDLLRDALGDRRASATRSGARPRVCPARSLVVPVLEALSRLLRAQSAHLAGWRPEQGESLAQSAAVRAGALG